MRRSNWPLKHRPDVVLLDVRMPDGDGLNCLARIKLDYAGHAGRHVQRVRQSDVRRPGRCAGGGRLRFEKREPRRDHRRDSHGRARRDDLVARRTAPRDRRAWRRREPATDVDVPLTKRESEVLKQLAFGLTNKEIAQSLGISYETVKEHVQHILRKIGVSDRTQAAVWAVRKNLV